MCVCVFRIECECLESLQPNVGGLEGMTTMVRRLKGNLAYQS